MTPRGPTWKRWFGLLLILNISIAFHIVVMRFGESLFANWDTMVWEAPVRIELLDGDPAVARLRDPLSPLDALPPTLDDPEETPVEEEEPDIPTVNGQIVETPAPDEEKIPLTADYLAEHNNAVPEETRSQRYKVNPEVLSNVYSEESKYQMDDVIDVGAKDYSTGATVGAPGPPDVAGKGPPRSALPSQWALTNKEGLAAPVPASSKTQSMAGAPQNDLLKEKLGPQVALNTREFLGAEYMNRIRRAVNFYWQQNLDNVSGSLNLSKSQYSTVVDVVLSGTGVLESIEITHPSGLDPVDFCVTEAFRIAGPFPNPPPQLIAKDGRVYLPDFDFTVQVGKAHMQYQGIDPRAGVQFPGILKSPR